ncbi:hypothetical protein J2847_005801 [Azospirillum agricola]|uniref:hypothetical protein n=1 Tax=Azospirillum agricola TaxID=1720247 RepID=UPI001AEA5713|nr:hypothetical protein [Azospirillum agricola]MBP2232472.1 hypothetical protein [Azospirillum agricola]
MADLMADKREYAQRWRDDAFHAAADIAERYGASHAATDIRAMAGGQPQAVAEVALYQTRFRYDENSSVPGWSEWETVPLSRYQDALHYIERGFRYEARALGVVSAAPPAPVSDPLALIRQAIADYHYALDTRLDGRNAERRAFDAIQAALGMEWVHGAEKARRDAKGGGRS